MLKGVHDGDIFWRQFPLIILNINEILIEIVMSIKTLNGRRCIHRVIPFERS